MFWLPSSLCNLAPTHLIPSELESISPYIPTMLYSPSPHTIVPLQLLVIPSELLKATLCGMTSCNINSQKLNGLGFSSSTPVVPTITQPQLRPRDKKIKQLMKRQIDYRLIARPIAIEWYRIKVDSLKLKCMFTNGTIRPGKNIKPT